MKKIFLAIVLLYIGSLTINAQNGFVIKAGYKDYLNIPQDMIIAPDNTFFFLFTSLPENSVYTNQILKLSNEGSILKSYTFTDSSDYCVELTQCVMTEDTLFAFGWGYRDSISNESYLLMQKFDHDLNIISSNRIRTNKIDPYGVGHGEIKCVNDKFYCINGYGTSGTQSPFYIELNKKGELIKFEKDSLMGCVHVPYDFNLNNESGGCKLFSVQTFDPQFPIAYGTIDFYNKDFEIESHYILPYDFLNFFTYESINETTGYISGQWTDWMSGNLPWRAGILKIEDDSTVVESFLYSTTPDSTTCPAYRHSLEILPDGNILFCFNSMTSQMFPTLEPGKINLMKLTPDLDVIWHRYIYEPDTKYDAFEMHATPDDEIVILGAFSLAPYTNFWDMQALFIKTNSEGLITGIHDDFPGISSTETMLYPNPAQDFAIVEFSLAYQIATLVISNISGQEVFRTNLTGNKQQVDISSVPAGNYIYRIFNQKGLYENGKLVVVR